MTDIPKILLADHLKTLKLPTFLRDEKLALPRAAAEGLDHVQFLARPASWNVSGGMIEWCIKAGELLSDGQEPGQLRLQKPSCKSSGAEFARCNCIQCVETSSPWGPVDPARPMGPAGGPPEGLSVSFTTADAGQRDDGTRRSAVCSACKKQLAGIKLLIIEFNWGFVPLSKTVLSSVSGYERGSTLITNRHLMNDRNLRHERPTGALLDRLTHHVTFSR